MAKRTKYTVYVGENIANFSDYRHAMLFARMMSYRLNHLDDLIEVSTKDGLVGQYLNGETTEEFKAHHDNAIFGS